MPGYRLTSSDQEKISNEYLCGYCKMLLRDAVQTNFGHLYCQSCLEPQFQRDQTSGAICAHDQELLLQSEVFPDNFRRREIRAFKVHCVFMEDGCQWKGEVQHLEGHMDNCEYLRVPCVHPECSMMVKKKDLANHLEKECKSRLQSCTFCKWQIKWSAMKQHHDSDCPVYPVVCSKCNKGGIPRAKMMDHQDLLRGDCDGVQAPCPFSAIGCSRTDVLSQEQKRQHLQQANTGHTSLLLQHAIRLHKEVESLVMRNPGFMSISPQLMSNHEAITSDLLAQVQSCVEEAIRDLQQKCQEQSERILFLERKVASGNASASAATGQRTSDSEGRVPNTELTRQITNVENKTADLERLMVEKNRNAEDSNRQIAALRRMLETAMETIRVLERRLESTDHTLALRNVALADLEEYIRQPEAACYDGILLWKISDFARRRNDALTGWQTSLYSPCFFTGRHGYKMCACIYLNGDGMGRGTHISVFFVVMRGQHDALLRWPFGQKVTMMLLDQDNIEHVTHAFRPDPNSSSFQRPRREMNVASGCPLFCPLSELNNHAYVRDDTMYIKIIVVNSGTAYPSENGC